MLIIDEYLDALPAEVDALKRLQAESRQRLHTVLDVLRPHRPAMTA